MAPGPLSPEDGAVLLALARGAIAEGLGLAGEAQPRPGPALKEKGACFVTLKTRGRLRGCIGSLEARRPLHEDALHNAQAAAFDDPRFPALSAAEFNELKLHISVLTPQVPLLAASEADLLAKLRPGLDGLVLKEDWRKATFLPSVWEELPDPQEFLDQLRAKAGLAEDYWSDRLEFFRYGVVEFE